MKFLIDMGLALRTVAFLRDRGHDATHLRDEGLERLDDSDVVKKAVNEKRVILTHDLDFSRIVALGGEAIPSVVTFRLKDMRPASVNSYLLEVLNRCAHDLEKEALVSVDERAIRVRSLPL